MIEDNLFSTNALNNMIELKFLLQGSPDSGHNWMNAADSVVVLF